MILKKRAKKQKLLKKFQIYTCAKCPHCAEGYCAGEHDQGYHKCAICGKHWII